MRVESDAEVTLVVLVYRSMRWLEWCMSGVDRARTSTKYRWLVVANDATDEVIGGLQAATFDWIDYRYPGDPNAHYIQRVYAAWNAGVMGAKTQAVVMQNSDMYPFDDWLDSLMWTKKTNPRSVPTSLLVESGRIPSAMPEHVLNCGLNPDEFDVDRFTKHARAIIKPGKTEPGRLYMPILVDRQEFMDVGGYPAGNPLDTTGDKDLIRRYAEFGFRHITALGSVVAHLQEGEMRWP